MEILARIKDRQGGFSAYGVKVGFVGLSVGRVSINDKQNFETLFTLITNCFQFLSGVESNKILLLTWNLLFLGVGRVWGLGHVEVYEILANSWKLMEKVFPSENFLKNRWVPRDIWNILKNILWHSPWMRP